MVARVPLPLALNDGALELPAVEILTMLEPVLAEPALKLVEPIYRLRRLEPIVPIVPLERLTVLPAVLEPTMRP